MKTSRLDSQVNKIFHVSFTFLVLLFWIFLVRFSGPPALSCLKEEEKHNIWPQMSRIGTQKLKETQKWNPSLNFWKYGRKIFWLAMLVRKILQHVRISRKLDLKYTISYLMKSITEWPNFKEFIIIYRVPECWKIFYNQ